MDVHSKTQEIIETNLEEILKFRNKYQDENQVPMHLPKAASLLCSEIISSNPLRFGEEYKGEYKTEFLKFSIAYCLAENGLKERKTGGRAMKHLMATAKELFEMGEQHLFRGEDYINVAVAILHDTVEDYVRDKIKSMMTNDSSVPKTNDSPARINWEAITNKVKAGYSEKAKKERKERLLEMKKQFDLYAELSIEKGNVREQVKKDIVRMMMIIDLLSNKEQNDYFYYIKRLKSQPAEKNQLELYDKIGFKLPGLEEHLMFEEGLEFLLLTGREYLPQNMKKIVKLINSIAIRSPGIFDDYFNKKIIRPAQRIKMLDRKDNITSMQASTGEHQDYIYTKQLYNIFKTIIILSSVNSDLSRRSESLQIDRTKIPEYNYFESLTKSAQGQLDIMMGCISDDLPNLQRLWHEGKKYLYKRALKIYDKYHGFTRPTLKGETSIPFWYTPLMTRPARDFDGIIAKYSGFIHKLVPEPRERDADPSMLLKNCLQFRHIIHELAANPSYNPSFSLGKSKTKQMLEG